MDEVIKAMQSDQSSCNYAYMRMKEVIDNAMIADYEKQLINLKQENILIKEKILSYEQSKSKGIDAQRIQKKAKKEESRKKYYKQQFSISQQQIQELIDKIKEYDAELQKQQTTHEFKMAEKEGELARCEKLLSEVRAMFSEKTMAHNRNQSNFSNEVTVLSDRVQILEKERGDLIDKYSKYGEEFKFLLTKEKGTYESHISKLKSKNKELRDLQVISDKRCLEIESSSRTYAKEVEDQRLKIDDLIKQV